MWLIITYLVYYSTSTLQRYNKKFEPTKFINIFKNFIWRRNYSSNHRDAQPHAKPQRR